MRCADLLTARSCRRGRRPQESWPVSTLRSTHYHVPETSGVLALSSRLTPARGRRRAREAGAPAVRGRGRAQRPPVECTGGHPSPPLVSEGYSLRIEAPCSVFWSGAWSSGGVRLSRRASTAVDRTRGRGGANSGGAGIPREHRPEWACASGAQVSRACVRRVRTPEGSKASKRAARPRADEPGSFGRLPRSACGATRTKDRWPEMTAAGNPRYRSRVAPRTPSRGIGPARGRRKRGKPVGDRRSFRVGESRSGPKPPGSKRPPSRVRRHGSSGG